MDVDRIIWFAIGLLFVLILLVVIATIMANADPDVFIATQNVKELRDTMNFACQNPGQAKTIEFALPQSVPYLVELFGGASGFLMARNGDPHYTLYYEAFPPGDAIGWESYYHVADAKAVIYLPQGYEGKNIDEVNNFFVVSRADIDGGLSNKNTFAEMIILGNVLLGEDSPKLVNYKLGPSKGIGSDPTATSNRLIAEFFDFGEWIYKDPVSKIPNAGDNYFDFGNYNSLSSQEKSAIKYIPCGDNSLCLKTRRNVYRYALDRCNDIQHVVFAYDSTSLSEEYTGSVAPDVMATTLTGDVARSIILRSPREIGHYTGRVAKWIFLRPLGIVLGAYDVASFGHYFYSAFLAYKSGDFSIASPCEAKMTVEKMACDSIPEAYKCSSYKKVPLYQYDENGGITSSGGNHYVCLDKVRDAPSGEDLTGECLFVKVSQTPEGYCWTADPYKDTAAFIEVPDAGDLASSLGLTPIRDHTSAAQAAGELAVILMPFDRSKLEWQEKLARKISWRWPIDKSDDTILSDLLESFTS